MRVWVNAATPVALKVIERMLPASWTETTTVVCCPGRTWVPDVAPVILTVGATESRTMMVTGAASTTCPLVSVTDAWMAIDDPGVASTGTMKPKASDRFLAGGAIARVAASSGLPVCALKLTCATPTSSVATDGEVDVFAVGRAEARRRHHDGRRRRQVSVIGTSVLSGGPRLPDVSVAIADTLI